MGYADASEQKSGLDIIEPGDGSSSSYPFPHFMWENPTTELDVANPLIFHIQIATDKDFDTIIDQDQIPIPRYVHDRPFKPGTYYWRVKGVDNNGVVYPYTEPHAFTINEAEKTIIIPYDGELSDHFPIVREKLAEAQALSQDGIPVRVVFEKGTYRFAGSGNVLSLSNTKDLIIDGQGSKLVFLAYEVGFSSGRNNTKLAIMNFEIAHSELRTFVQGTVTKVNEEDASLELQLENNSPAFTEKNMARIKGASFAVLIDPDIPAKQRDLSVLHYFPDVKRIQEIGERRYRWAPKNRSRISNFREGDRLVQKLSARGGSYFTFHDSDYVTLYGVIGYESTAMNYVGIKVDRLNILHCETKLKEGRWFCGNSDGGHFKASRIGPWVEYVKYAGTGDDGFASYQRPFTIVEAHPDGNRRQVVLANVFDMDVRPGDNVALFNPRIMDYYDLVKVVQVENLGTKALTSGLAPHEVSGLNDANKQAQAEQVQHYRVTFDREVKATGNAGTHKLDNDQLWNRSTSCPYIAIRNCLYRNIRRYGNVTRSHWGVIENNRYENITTSSVAMKNGPAWPNGPFASDFIIQNNTFNRSAFVHWGGGAIWLVAEGRPGGKRIGPGPRNILVRNNVISDWEIAAIAIKYCRNIRIENNHIKDGKQADFLFESKAVFEIENSSGISILQNRVDDKRSGYAYYAIKNTSGLDIKGNTHHDQPSDYSR
jgi:hypothetical protein